MATGDIYLLRVIGEDGTNKTRFVNTFHYQLVSPLVSLFGAEAELNGLIDSWIDDVEEAYLEMTSSRYNLLKYEARGTTDPTVGIDRDASGAGAGSANCLANQLSCIMNKRTGRIGGKYRGSIKLPPATEENLTGGVFNEDYLIAAQAFGDAALAPGLLVPIAWGFTLGVWSKEGEFFTQCTSFTPNQIPGTLVRRRIGVGA